MGKAFQSKLNNYINLDITSSTAAEIVRGIDLNDLFNIDGGFVLPPDAPNSKYPAIDFGRFLVFHIVKGNRTVKKTYSYLKANPCELEKIGIKVLPEYANIVSFIRLRMGKEKLAELKTAVNEYVHDRSLLIRDNVDALKAKRNQQVIYSAKGKKISKDVKRIVLNLVKQNPDLKRRCSNKDIMRMTMDTICDERGSFFGFTKRRRNDYEAYERGEFPTSHTMFSQLREIFSSDNAFDDFFYKATRDIINELIKYNPELFNRNKFNIAIDTVCIPTWESVSKSPDPNSILRNAELKQKGTDTFREYDCLSIIVHGYRFVIAYLPLKEGDKHNKERNVEKLILRAKSLIPLGIVIMDKEFETDEVIKLSNSMKIQFITPTKRTRDIKEIMDTMNGSVKICKRIIHGEEVANLVILKEQIGPFEYETLPYTTNINFNEKNAHQIVGLYKTRWGIETNFRDLKIYKPLTTSRDSQIRNIFFGTATIMLNLWVLGNLIGVALYIKKMPDKPPIDKITFKKYFEGPVPDT